MNREHALSVLRKLRGELQARGITRVALIGSLARDMGTLRSDVDVVVTPAIGQRLDLIDFGAVQTLLEEAFGCEVDVLVEPVRRQHLREAIERDRVDAF